MVTLSATAKNSFLTVFSLQTLIFCSCPTPFYPEQIYLVTEYWLFRQLEFSTAHDEFPAEMMTRVISDLSGKE